MVSTKQQYENVKKNSHFLKNMGTGSKKPKNHIPRAASTKQGGGMSKDHWPKRPSTRNTQTSDQKKSGSVQNRLSQTKRGPAMKPKSNQNQVRQNQQPHPPPPPPPSSNRNWETQRQNQNQDSSQDMLRKMLARLDQQVEELKDLKNNSLQYQDSYRDRSRE